MRARVVVAAAFAGPPLAARTHPTATITVKVTATATATESKFTLSPSSVKPERVAFTVVNKGKLSHDFKIDGKETPFVCSA